MDAIGADKGKAANAAGAAVGFVEGGGDATGMADRVKAPDAEDDVYIGEALAGGIEHRSEICTVHDRVGGREMAGHRRAQRQGGEGTPGAKRKKVDAGRFEALSAELHVEAETDEDRTGSGGES